MPFYDTIQLARYDAEEQGFFRWHSDTIPSDMTRKLTVVVPLSDPADYEEALEQFRLAGRIVGEHFYRPRFFQARALTDLGRFDEALAIIRDLRAGDDSRTRIYDDMEARTLRRMGDRRGAEASGLQRFLH